MSELFQTTPHYNLDRWCLPCPACGASFYVEPRKAPEGAPVYVWGVVEADCVNVLRKPDHTVGPCGARWRISWPTPERRAEIEAVLSLRPDARTRNWQPHETVDQLRSENRLHELPRSLDEIGDAAPLLLDEPLPLCPHCWAEMTPDPRDDDVRQWRCMPCTAEMLATPDDPKHVAETVRRLVERRPANPVVIR